MGKDRASDKEEEKKWRGLGEGERDRQKDIEEADVESR